MQRRTAFTLIELLVVIAIIAILAAILFPVFAQAKMAAKKTSDLSQMKQIGTALHIYFNDFDDMAPLATFNAIPNWTDHYRWSSDRCIGPYLKNKGILLAPTDAGVTLNGIPDWAKAEMKARNAVPSSYMANAMRTSGTDTWYFGTPTPGFQLGLLAAGRVYNNDPETATSLTQAVYPSELIMLTEGAQDLGAYWNQPPWNISSCLNVISNEWAYCESDVHKPDVAYYLASGDWFGNPPKVTKVWREYNNSANYVMADSSARSLKPGQLMNGAQLSQHRWLVSPAAGQ